MRLIQGDLIALVPRIVTRSSIVVGRGGPQILHPLAIPSAGRPKMAGGSRVPLRRTIDIVNVDLVVFKLLLQHRYVPHVAVHPAHQALVFVHKPTHGMPGICGTGQIAVRLHAQIAGDGFEEL